MEKLIVIDGKEIVLKANVKSALIYRSEFKEDILKAQGQLINASIGNNGTLDITKLDSMLIYKLLWTFAKTNDASVLPFENWLESFEVIPLLDVLQDVCELIMANMTSNSPIKNAVREK